LLTENSAELLKNLFSRVPWQFLPEILQWHALLVVLGRGGTGRMIHLLALNCDAPESIQPAAIVLGPRLWALSAVAGNPSFCRHSVYVLEKSHLAFENGRKARSVEDANVRKIEQLEAKLTRKNEVMAELMEAHTLLKKELGEI